MSEPGSQHIRTNVSLRETAIDGDVAGRDWFKDRSGELKAEQPDTAVEDRENEAEPSMALEEWPDMVATLEGGPGPVGSSPGSYEGYSGGNPDPNPFYSPNPFHGEPPPGAESPRVVSLDEAARQALGVEVRLGALGIDVPLLRQGRSDLVRVAISREEQARAVIASLVDTSQVPDIDVINTSAVMFVDLIGKAFEITRLNPSGGEQLVSDTAVWEFDVVPQASGFQSMSVTASMRIPVPGHGERTVSIPTLKRDMRVEVNRLYTGRLFVKRNWQWIGTSVIAIAAVVAAVVWR